MSIKYYDEPTDCPCDAEDCDNQFTTIRTSAKPVGRWCSKRCYWRIKDRQTKSLYGTDRHCKDCGAFLLTIGYGRGRPPSVCRDCAEAKQKARSKERYDRTYQKREIPPRPCKRCGEEYTPLWEDDVRRSTFCPTCREGKILTLQRLRGYAIRGIPTFFRRCPACLKRFSTLSKVKQHCSIDCKYIDQSTPTDLIWISCRGCRELIPLRDAFTGKKKCCPAPAAPTGFARCRQCRHWFSTPIPMGSSTPANCPDCKAILTQQQRARGRRMRRSRLASVMSGSYTLQDIVARDGWDCHLCGEACIPPSIPWVYNPLAATVDHVVPIARFGPDILANVRLAHHSCNAKRQTKMLPLEQLSLYFEAD